jgi:hypothetical protein
VRPLAAFARTVGLLPCLSLHALVANRAAHRRIAVVVGQEISLAIFHGAGTSFLEPGGRLHAVRGFLFAAMAIEIASSGWPCAGRVSVLPPWQAETFANVVAAETPIVAGVAVSQKAIRRGWIKFHRQ